MTPSFPRRSFPLLAAASLALSLLCGCNKPADEEDVVPPGRQTVAAPTPSPVSEGSERQGRKALSAYNAVSEYLKDQDPNLREHLQKAAAKFVRDKEKWRDRLASRQRELQPKIARLREQLTKAEGKSTEALHNLRQELSGLESQRADADRKLSELESITSETWKSFQERLGSDDNGTSASPTPVRR